MCRIVEIDYNSEFLLALRNSTIGENPEMLA